MTATAITIYQDFLDRMGAALISRDANTFLRHIFLSHVVKTEDATFRIEDRAKGRRHFGSFTSALSSQGSDAYTRIVRQAQFVGQAAVNGVHDTYITAKGKLVMTSCADESSLIFRDGIWRAIGTRHRARFMSSPDLLPRPGS